MLIAGAIFNNMTSGKISQDYKWAYGFYSQMKDINIDDESAMNDAFTNYSAVVNDVTGVTVTDGENILYQNGEEISDIKTDINEYSQFIEVYGEEIDNYKIYLDTSDDSYFDKFLSGDLAFIRESLLESSELSGDMEEASNFNELMNKSVFQQTCYYGFDNDDGTVTYVTLRREFIFWMGKR